MSSPLACVLSLPSSWMLCSRRALPLRSHARGWLSLVPSPPLRCFERSETVGWSAEALFAVVADVGRYAEFVPLCTRSRVLRTHTDDAFDATLGLGYMGIAEEYTSRVQLHRPSEVVAEALDARLFKRMRTVWRFEPIVLGGPRLAAGATPGGDTLADARSFAAGACKLSLSIEMQLRAHAHDQLLRAIMDQFAGQQVNAFKQRCVELYGEGLPVDSVGTGYEWPTGNSPRSLVQPLTGVGKAEARGGSTSRDVGGCPESGTNSCSSGLSIAQDEQAQDSTERRRSQRTSSTCNSDSLLSKLRIDPKWRADVERAFEAHALNDALSLGRFVEACRSLGCRNGALASLPGTSSGVLQLVIQPASTVGKVVQAAASISALNDVGIQSADEAIDSRSLLTAVLFVEFDADGNGAVTRDEFVSHLWMLTNASEEEKQVFTFEKLDVNRSGKLERDDLVASMKRQLSLAKAVSPLIVQQQLRRHSIADSERKNISNTAVTAACEAINKMTSQVRGPASDCSCV